MSSPAPEGSNSPAFLSPKSRLSWSRTLQVLKIGAVADLSEYSYEQQASPHDGEVSGRPPFVTPVIARILSKLVSNKERYLRRSPPISLKNTAMTMLTL